jgi:hypothetical protein
MKWGSIDTKNVEAVLLHDGQWHTVARDGRKPSFKISATSRKWEFREILNDVTYVVQGPIEALYGVRTRQEP